MSIMRIASTKRVLNVPPAQKVIKTQRSVP